MCCISEAHVKWIKNWLIYTFQEVVPGESSSTGWIFRVDLQGAVLSLTLITLFMYGMEVNRMVLITFFYKAKIDGLVNKAG